MRLPKKLRVADYAYWQRYFPAEVLGTGKPQDTLQVLHDSAAPWATSLLLGSD
jgi:hypothetical protein